MRMEKRILASLLCLLLMVCAGCGGSAGSSGSSVSNSAVSGGYATDFAPAEPEIDGWSSTVSSEGSYESPEDSAVRDVPDLSEKIVYSADLTVETLEFDSSVAALEQLTAELGGFVESSQVTGNTRRQSDGTTLVVDRCASYRIRIPAEHFTLALTRAGSLGNVTFSSRDAENITSRFTDQEARKHSLEVQEERLLDMLSKAEDVDTLIVLESRLSEVRYEIESIERTLRNWQAQVDYSTVSVSLREVAVYTPTAPVQRTFLERLGSAFADGWSGFLDFLQDLAIFLAEALPGLILLGAVVAAVAVPIRRRIRRRRGASPKDPPQAADGTDQSREDLD